MRQASALGFRVTVRPFVLRVNDVCDTGVPDGSRNSKLAAVTVAAAIASLKVAVMLAVLLTPVAPLAGDVDVTVGGVVSIVKVQTLSTASALPATSFTPLAPPRTIAV